MDRTVYICLEDTGIAHVVAARLTKDGHEARVIDRPNGLVDALEGSPRCLVVQDRYREADVLATSMLRQARLKLKHPAPTVIVVTGHLATVDRHVLEHDYAVRSFLSSTESPQRIAIAALSVLESADDDASTYDPASSQFYVVITEKGGTPKREVFTQNEITIGRVQGNDIVLPKGNISKRHTRIVLRDGKFIVVDLKTTNGTFVNGKRINTPQVLKDGDKIYVGDFTLQIELSGGNDVVTPVRAYPAPPPVPPTSQTPVTLAMRVDAICNMLAFVDELTITGRTLTGQRPSGPPISAAVDDDVARALVTALTALPFDDAHPVVDAPAKVPLGWHVTAHAFRGEPPRVNLRKELGAASTSGGTATVDDDVQPLPSALKANISLGPRNKR